jgi:serpin B
MVCAILSRKNVLIALTVTVTLILCGCTDIQINSIARKVQTHTPSIDELRNYPSAPETVNDLADKQKTFAIELFKSMDLKENGNTAISPYSISSVLSMAYAGAASTTREEMREALQYYNFSSNIHSLCNNLQKNISSSIPVRDTTTQLIISNHMWVENSLPLKSEYIDILTSFYDGQISRINFKTDPSGSCKLINAAIANRTNNRITSLLSEESIDKATKAILTNAIYFKALWEYPFENGSVKRPFSGMNETRQVDFMSQEGSFNYSETPEYQIVELPYKKCSLVMDIIIPKSSSLKEFIFTLNNSLINKAIQNLTPTNVVLSIPKFSFTTGTIRLRNALQALGMNSPFNSNADFSIITDEKPLFISDVVHKAFFSISEKGTEAAAATAVVMGGTSLYQIPKTFFTANKPFLFMIREVSTGSILFIGKVEMP